MAGTWVLIASKPSYSTIGKLIAWSTLPWLLLMYYLLPTGIPGTSAAVRIVSVPLLFGPITVWLIAQVFSASRWMSWFYTIPSRVRLEDEGLGWQSGEDPPVLVGPWARIAGFVTRGGAPVLIDASGQDIGRPPPELRWVLDPSTNRTYTLAAAILMFRPQQFGVAAMFGPWPEELRPREAAERIPDIPVRLAPTESRRRQALILVAMVVAFAVVAWLRAG